MIEKRVDKRSEQVWRTRRESAGCDLIDRLPQFGIRLVNSTRLVPLPPQGRYLFGGETKQKEIFFPDFFTDFFMFPVPEASFPAVEICSERSAAG